MTSGDLWRAVGRELREVRERQPGPTFMAHFADLAEIDVNTAKAIERGEPRSITKLEDYAFALGLSIVDVLFNGAEGRGTAPHARGRRFGAVL